MKRDLENRCSGVAVAGCGINQSTTPLLLRMKSTAATVEQVVTREAGVAGVSPKPRTSVTGHSLKNCCGSLSRICWTAVLILLASLPVPMAFGQETETKEPVKEQIALQAGDHSRTLMMGEQKRYYIVHVPAGYDPESPTPVVLALHGAGMNGSMMVWFTGLNKTADENGFIVVYPSGTGRGAFLTWNAGGLIGRMKSERVDDVAFMGSLLDELETLVNVDPKRVYACGMSNGGMMCYRLAAEMSDRFAAFAPVAGTMATDTSEPKRPVPIMHFHGTKDDIVPFGPPHRDMPPLVQLKGVEDTIQTWVKLNGCNETPATDELSKEGDKTKVTRQVYSGGKEDSEVISIVIEGGGHTWPGRQLPIGFLGKAARNISANELIWEFFKKHQLK